jgi:hypothetical protein
MASSASNISTVLGSMPDDIEKGGKKEQNAYTSIDAKTLQRY